MYCLVQEIRHFRRWSVRSNAGIEINVREDILLQHKFVHHVGKIKLP
jgi:hypothetical protein